MLFRSEGGGESHGDAVRSRETVGGDRGTEGAGEKNAKMRDEEKRCPEDGRADGEMVIKVAGRSAKVRAGLIVFVEARAAETFVSVLVVSGEIEAVLNQRGASKGVIADAVAADPRIEKWQREKKEKKQQALGIARRTRGGCVEILVVHERDIRLKTLLPRLPLLQGSSARQSQFFSMTGKGTW